MVLFLIKVCVLQPSNHGVDKICNLSHKNAPNTTANSQTFQVCRTLRPCTHHQVTPSPSLDFHLPPPPSPPTPSPPPYFPPRPPPSFLNSMKTWDPFLVSPASICVLFSPLFSSVLLIFSFIPVDGVDPSEKEVKISRKYGPYFGHQQWK